MLFCTINDFSTLGNLSGFSTKGAKACQHCLDGTESVWLNNSRKTVYMRHRRFLPRSRGVRSVFSVFRFGKYGIYGKYGIVSSVNTVFLKIRFGFGKSQFFSVRYR